MQQDSSPDRVPPDGRLTKIGSSEGGASEFWLPERSMGGASGDVRLALRPPVDLEIDYAGGQYLIVIPYTEYPASIQLEYTTGDPTRLQGRMSGQSGLIAPPADAVHIQTGQPAELLVIEIGRSRAEKIIDRAAGEQPWQPKPIVNLIDQGIASLAVEARRSLLSDPIMAPPYLEALADAMIARFACKIVGLGLGALPREALAPAIIKRVIEKIDRDLAEKIRIEDLAELAGLSRSHFSRAFQATTGQSPQEFLIQRRLCEARNRLTGTQQAISEIAYASGFSSQSHLTRAFKKHLGLTPGQYRNAFRMNAAESMA